MKNTNRTIAILTLIVLGVATRFLPHPPNFTAVGAAALLGGALFKNGFKALLIPFATIFISDLCLNNLIYAGTEGFTWFTEGALFLYGAYLLISLLGRLMAKNQNLLNVGLTSVVAALVFFLVSNIGSWLVLPIYAKNLSGLMQAYVAGLPFLGAQVASMVVYSLALFTIAKLWIKQPSLTTEHA